MEEITSSDLHGRIGRFALPNGNVITPTLLPVIDPKNNIIPPQEMKDKFDFNFVITSAYLYYKRHGMPSDSSNIHDTLNFDGNIMMDSGAYQILMYGDVEIDPVQSLQIQSKLKSDVGVILDVPTPPTDTFKQAKEKVEETIRRVEISLPHIRENPETIWTLPIQGGKNIQLIQNYLETIKQNNYLDSFGFHALGSVAPLMSQYNFVSLFAMIKAARELLPHNVPFHLFGAGHPMMFPFVVALGCDTFDSAAYVLYAKENRYMTTAGTYHLPELIEFPCNCEICSKWNPKELLETDRETRMRNIALHNLYVSHSEIKNIRTNLRDGNLWELLERRSKSHPSLYKAFKLITKEYRGKFLEFATPVTKQIGLKVYDEDSFYRPEYTRARNQLYNNFQPKTSKLVILISAGNRNPIELLISRKEIKEQILQKIESYDFAFLVPFIGLVPVELTETFPFSQYFYSNILSDEMIDYLLKEVNIFTKTMNYKEIVMCLLDSEENSQRILSNLQKLLKNKEIVFSTKELHKL